MILLSIKLFFLLFSILAYNNLFSFEKREFILIKNQQREYFIEYFIFLPDDYKKSLEYSLVFIFHGGGRNTKQIMKYTKFNQLANKEKYIVVYPEALDPHWTEERKISILPQNDDIRFIDELIKHLIKQYSINQHQNFAPGIFNGGFICIYLAYHLSNRIRAIAPVAANIPENISRNIKTKYPVSILLMNGTDDPLVKYNGGSVGFGEKNRRGKSIPTEETLHIWKNNNGCENQKIIEEIEYKDKQEVCKAVKISFEKCQNHTRVTSIQLIECGHTWPWSFQYLPEFVIGKTCKDFFATDIIWNFFKNTEKRI